MNENSQWITFIQPPFCPNRGMCPYYTHTGKNQIEDSLRLSFRKGAKSFVRVKGAGQYCVNSGFTHTAFRESRTCPPKNFAF